MTKKDLKTGMIVEMCDGTLRMVLAGGLMGLTSGGGIPLTSISSDLEQNAGEKIVKVYSEANADDSNYIGAGLSWYTRPGQTRAEVLIYTKLLWERKPDAEELTLEQVCKELGRDIKIVK